MPLGIVFISEGPCLGAGPQIVEIIDDNILECGPGQYYLHQ